MASSTATTTPTTTCLSRLACLLPATTAGGHNNNNASHRQRTENHTMRNRSSTRNAAPYFMNAKFAGTCPETGKTINKGDRICFAPATRKAYHDESQQASETRGQQFAAAHNMADANY